MKVMTRLAVLAFFGVLVIGLAACSGTNPANEILGTSPDGTSASSTGGTSGTAAGTTGSTSGSPATGSSGSSTIGEGQLTVAIYDAPADFTAINVTISAMTVYPVGGDPMPISDGLPATLNLLDYVGADNALNLTTDLVPAGDYTGLDMTLTSVEVVTAGGPQELLGAPMTVAVPTNFTVADGGVVTVFLHFNADTSFQVVGTDIVFDPVITAD